MTTTVSPPSDDAPVHPPIETVPGGLRYRIYGQDGKFVYLTCKDTPDMRRFVEWVRIHDRYGVKPAPSDEGLDDLDV